MSGLLKQYPAQVMLESARPPQLFETECQLTPCFWKLDMRR